MSATIRLRDGEARAEIATLGAELRSWSVARRPLIWTPVPDIWPDTAPILFPVVGWTRGHKIRVDDVCYPLGLHGFARRMIFDVEVQASNRARFVLRDTTETRLLYPFGFSLAVTYRLAEARLHVTLAVQNTGDTPMLYACGLHPGFRWPFAGGTLDDYTILFSQAEMPDVPIISPEGLFTRDKRSLPLDGRRLDLSAALFAREALCFLDAKSRDLTFGRRDEPAATITLALDGFPHIALWSKPKGGFLCIEAWTGHGDHVDSSGDLSMKPSMLPLDPGQSREHSAAYAYGGRVTMGSGPFVEHKIYGGRQQFLSDSASET